MTAPASVSERPSIAAPADLVVDDAEFARRVEIAQEMRALPEGERDQLILAADNVLDLRPRLAGVRKQSALAEGYRRPRS